MPLKDPARDSFPRAGSDLWDQGAAGVVYYDDFFGSSAPVGGVLIGALVLTAGVLSAVAVPAGGDTKVYLNDGLLYGKTSPAGGDVLVNSYSDGLRTT